MRCHIYVYFYLLKAFPNVYVDDTSLSKALCLLALIQDVRLLLTTCMVSAHFMFDRQYKWNAKNDFHVRVLSDLDFWSFDLWAIEKLSASPSSAKNKIKIVFASYSSKAQNMTCTIWLLSY